MFSPSLNPKLCPLRGAFQRLRLTVTVGEVQEAAGAGVAVLAAVIRFAEAATGQILAGTICEF